MSRPQIPRTRDVLLPRPLTLLTFREAKTRKIHANRSRAAGAQGQIGAMTYGITAVLMTAISYNLRKDGYRALAGCGSVEAAAVTCAPFDTLRANGFGCSGQTGSALRANGFGTQGERVRCSGRTSSVLRVNGFGAQGERVRCPGRTASALRVNGFGYSGQPVLSTRRRRALGTHGELKTSPAAR